MVIHFEHTLQNALREINFVEHSETFVVHNDEKTRILSNSCEIVEKYGQAKNDVVKLINDVYGRNFDLHNWIERKTDDEVSYFLSEAGSNVLNYSQFKAPSSFNVWFGKKGFIIGVEQKGKSFNAKFVHDNNVKSNEGMAFSFFKRCQNKIFFDHPQDSNIVYLEFLF
ncbi:hypothetical protein COY27_00310 [Candidatus Woesearchaeota archaeon CG_4_10_14_0_2_um_filter_33_13]|nr:MAG: hypothetical protein COY27_00310 [Candidatus Woesearchaeota archaeon CG_4_10_14_0_2_um_filter_33_13]